MFQNTIQTTYALGSAGQVTSPYYNITEAIAAGDDVCVGCFVQTKTGATNELEVIGASGVAISGKILGVVVKNKYISSDGVAAKNTYKKGDGVSVLNSGSIIIETETAATKGQYVFLKDDNGALIFNDANTLADHTYTGFRVSRGATGGGIIEISTALGQA